MQSAQIGLARRLQTALMGQGSFRRLAVIHLSQALGDGLFAVSLAGSLFFSVSVDAARPNILLYLLLTMAPFALLAPLIGPMVDRVAQGYPRVVATANLLRAALCVLLAVHLRTVLFYPEALAVLVSAKTYSVAKAALVPRLVPERSVLLASNARLSRLGALGGAIGGGVGAAAIGLIGAEVSVLLAATAFSVSALAAFRLPRPQVAPLATAAEEFEELHDPDVLAAAASVAVMRAASGFLAFMIAFELKRNGSAPWVFGVMAGASALAAVGGTLVGPRLRHRYDEKALIRTALVVPALVCVAGAVQVGPVVLVVCVIGLSMSSNVGRLAFDSLVQANAPDVDRGRAFAGFETRFQLAWVAGAVGPVIVRVPGWIGLLVTSGLLATGGLAFSFERKALLRWRNAVAVHPDLPRSVLEQARHLQANGRFRHAVIEAALLVDLLPGSDPTITAPAAVLHQLRNRALAGDAGPNEAHQALRHAVALRNAHEALETAPLSAADDIPVRDTAVRDTAVRDTALVDAAVVDPAVLDIAGPGVDGAAVLRPGPTPPAGFRPHR